MQFVCIVHVYMCTCTCTRMYYAAIHVNQPSGISQAAALAVNRTKGVLITFWNCTYSSYNNYVTVIISSLVCFFLIFRQATREKFSSPSHGSVSCLPCLAEAEDLSESIWTLAVFLSVRPRILWSILVLSGAESHLVWDIEITISTSSRQQYFLHVVPAFSTFPQNDCICAKT